MVFKTHGACKRPRDVETFIKLVELGDRNAEIVKTHLPHRPLEQTGNVELQVLEVNRFSGHQNIIDSGLVIGQKWGRAINGQAELLHLDASDLVSVFPGGAVPALLLERYLHIGRAHLADVGSQQRNFFEDRCREERVLLAGHERGKSTLGYSLLVGEGDLKLELEVGDSAQAPHHDFCANLPRKITVRPCRALLPHLTSPRIASVNRATRSCVSNIRFLLGRS